MPVGRVGNGSATHYISDGRTECGKDAEKANILPDVKVATCIRCRKATR